MSNINEFTCSVSMFFRLNLSMDNFREAFKSTSIQLQIAPIPQQEIAPSITLTPPKILIGTFEGSNIEYLPDRYLLQTRGSIDVLTQVLNTIEEGFNSIKYDLDEITRFYEFQINRFSVADDNYSENFNNMIEIKGIERIQEIVGLEFKPWEISFVYPYTPMSDQWFNIIISSDVFSPKNNAKIRIIKRCELKTELIDLITIIPNLVEEITNLYIKGEYNNI